MQNIPFPVLCPKCRINRKDASPLYFEDKVFVKVAYIPYFLLKGRSDKSCVKPVAAKPMDAVYNWTWDNLKSLINGAR